MGSSESDGAAHAQAASIVVSVRAGGRNSFTKLFKRSALVFRRGLLRRGRVVGADFNGSKAGLSTRILE